MLSPDIIELNDGPVHELLMIFGINYHKSIISFGINYHKNFLPALIPPSTLLLVPGTPRAHSRLRAKY